ncbi:MAG: hypothetical protein SCAL_000059 [Candidatus Syntrophoarchaeum caldarius]|uniref:Uncharacterized protein n=1 Tax=Candidatus Syntropharchaeum caldarium TaxID=1838285 RepID=A0A1F2PAV3_9EURY|nr:MAG: hypothetical protein SCAL_000059 [Candidatus Syntrophoarchaeum caldarius]
MYKKVCVACFFVPKYAEGGNIFIGGFFKSSRGNRSIFDGLFN